MLNTAGVPAPHHQRAPQLILQHKANTFASLNDPEARHAAFMKLQQIHLQQELQHRIHTQLCLGPVEGGSPPGPHNDLPHPSATVVLERTPPKAEYPRSPPTPTTSNHTSTCSSAASSPSTSSDVDHLKDSIRHVEELMKAPQQAHSAIQKIHKGQRISGMDREDFVRARKIKSPCSAFAEVAEIKLIVYQLLLAPPAQQQLADSDLPGIQALLHNAHVNMQANAATNAPLHNNNNGLNGTNGRKRSANFGNGGGPSQPEQPVALRPAIANCGINGGFSQWAPSSTWNLFGRLQTSPTLPGAAPTTETASAGDNKLWSSPSSVESGHKPESNAGDSNIDPVGMESDGSPTSSTCTTSPADVLNSFVAVQNSAMAHSNGVHERKPRKQISDDYVKLIRQQHELSGKNISDIQIPVPEALECDPMFSAISEQQIVQQVVQQKKFDEMSPKDVQEATTQLCKKLAEKRVFGPRLMAQTTVAGPNHSTYNNLPDEGIIYIQHVCRTVLKDKLKSEEEFWDVFREAMRKLAARCRRVRHAKKTKSMKENGVIALQQSDNNPLAMLSAAPFGEDWLEKIKMHAENVVKQEEGSPPHSSSSSAAAVQSLLLAQQAQHIVQQFAQNIKSESPEEPSAAQLQLEEDKMAEWQESIRRLAQGPTASPVRPLSHVFQDA